MKSTPKESPKPDEDEVRKTAQKLCKLGCIDICETCWTDAYDEILYMKQGNAPDGPHRS